MRPPKEKDIGLIFDIVIANAVTKARATLDVRVRGEQCCLELMSDNETFCSGPKLVGGYFGKIEPGSVITVSAIWPTSILFNRKGSCDVTLSSSLNSSVSNAISDKIYFDTNISCKKIPAIMKSYVNRRHVCDCSTIDLNPFQNCTQMDCEEKYFGQRNYFNIENKLCEIVPKCSGPNIVYNYLTNECIDTTKLVTDADMEVFKSGKISNNIWDMKRETDDKLLPKESAADSQPTLDEIKWLTAVDALLIATGSIIFYLSICFCIFMCFNIASQKSKKTRFSTQPPSVISSSKTSSKGLTSSSKASSSKRLSSSSNYKNN